jgi:hypothetical protein
MIMSGAGDSWHKQGEADGNAKEEKSNYGARSRGHGQTWHGDRLSAEVA